MPEVLSVCTVQFKSVCDAVRAKARRFLIQGDEIKLDLGVGCYQGGFLGIVDSAFRVPRSAFLAR